MYRDVDLIWSVVFQFPSADGNRESLIWRKYKPSIQEVHSLGCEKERKKPDKPYKGAITGRAKEITAVRTEAKGHGIFIEHEPDEGIEHVAIGYAPNPLKQFTKNDKAELKKRLSLVFTSIDFHSCK